jgi:hypothetical protein
MEIYVPIYMTVTVDVVYIFLFFFYTVLRKLDLFTFFGVEVPTQSGPLERANLSHCRMSWNIGMTQFVKVDFNCTGHCMHFGCSYQKKLRKHNIQKQMRYQPTQDCTVVAHVLQHQ